MKNDSNITDRTIERLKLGELSEEESAALMARLEAADETHRLDDLIDADEGFLERHPAAPAASQIRELARRRARKGRTSSDGGRRWRIVVLPATAATLLITAMIGLSLFTPFPGAEDSKSAARNADGLAKTAETGSVAPNPSTPSPSPPKNETKTQPDTDRRAAPSLQHEDAHPWNGLLDWAMANETDGLIGIACSPDQELRFDAHSVERVSIDQTKFLTVEPTPDGSELVVTCNEPGLANMNVFRTNDATTNVMVRIAAPHFDRSRSSISPVEELDIALGECGRLEDMAMQIVVERSFPAMVIVGGGSDAQRACVEKAARSFRGSPARPETDPSHLLIERSW